MENVGTPRISSEWIQEAVSSVFVTLKQREYTTVVSKQLVRTIFNHPRQSFLLEKSGRVSGRARKAAFDGYEVDSEIRLAGRTSFEGPRFLSRRGHVACGVLTGFESRC